MSSDEESETESKLEIEEDLEDEEPEAELGQEPDKEPEEEQEDEDPDAELQEERPLALDFDLDMPEEICPLSIEKPTLEQMNDHVWYMCNVCSARKIEDRTGGRELLFPAGMPKWIKDDLEEAQKEAAKQAPAPSTSPPTAAPAPTKPKTRQQLMKEEREKNKPDYMKVLDKIKQGKTKREAQLELAKEKREEFAKKLAAGEIEPLKEKKAVQKDMMPWVPPPQHHFKVPGKQLSVLDHAAHKRYVAIMSNNLDFTRQLRFDENKLEIQQADENLEPERKIFSDHVYHIFKNAKKIPYLYIDFNAKTYCKERTFKRTRHLCEKYSKDPVARVEWPDSTEGAILRSPMVVETVECGRYRKLQVPDIRRKCTVKQNLESVQEKFPVDAEDENRIENDPIAEEISNKHGVRIAADAGTLRRLFVGKSISHCEDLAYPVTIKRVLNEGRLENFAIIGKPVVTNAVNNPTLWRRYTKLLIKDALGYLKDTLEPSTPESVKTPDLTSTATDDDEDDILGGILGKMTEKDNDDGEGDKVKRMRKPKSRTKKRYSIVAFGEDESAKILVRSNNDGRENTMAVSWSHKIEYVPNICAEKMSDEEWLWALATSTLKDSKAHLHFRVHYSELDILQIERMQSSTDLFSSSPTERKALAGERTDRIARLIDEIERLRSGNYLLMENNGAMLILPEPTGGEDPESLIEAASLTPDLFAKPALLPSFDQCFNGIDNHLILVWHLVVGRIPGSLPPSDFFKNMNKFGDKGNNNKQFKKNRGRKRRAFEQSGSDEAEDRSAEAPSEEPFLAEPGDSSYVPRSPTHEPIPSRPSNAPSKQKKQKQHPLFKKFRGGPKKPTSDQAVDLDDPKNST